MVLSDILLLLSARARERGLTDARWAERAGVRQETLSRLRRRRSCDFGTLTALAEAVGSRLDVIGVEESDVTPDGLIPAHLDRSYEERLVKLCASGNLDPRRWSHHGPRFFMAGLAVMLAGEPGRDRGGLLSLAERLHPGASEVAVFNRWLERSPVRPTRFLPLIDAHALHAA